MELLPESEQNFVLEFIRKLVLAWDPDYTKVTPRERVDLQEALSEKITQTKTAKMAVFVCVIFSEKSIDFITICVIISISWI